MKNEKNAICPVCEEYSFEFPDDYEYLVFVDDIPEQFMPSELVDLPSIH